MSSARKTIFLNSMNDWKQEFTVGLLREPEHLMVEFTFAFDVCDQEARGDSFTWFPIKDDPGMGLDVKILRPSEFVEEEETQAVKDWVAQNIERIVNTYGAMVGD